MYALPPHIKQLSRAPARFLQSKGSFMSGQIMSQPVLTQPKPKTQVNGLWLPKMLHLYFVISISDLFKPCATAVLQVRAPGIDGEMGLGDELFGPRVFGRAKNLVRRAVLEDLTTVQEEHARGHALYKAHLV